MDAAEIVTPPHGPHALTNPNVEFTKYHLKHPNITIGDYTYGCPTVRWLIGDETITVGRFVSFGQNVEIQMSGNHPIDTVSNYPFPALKKDWPKAQGTCPIARGNVVIGNDVWIGKDVKILSGVTIGDGAVIGTSAVVAKDVEPYAIVVGNPIREVRKRFDDKTIEMLLNVKWWDWDHDKLQRNADILTSTDIWKILEAE